ncbi:signal peptide peptidase SppA [Persephonella sp.]
MKKKIIIGIGIFLLIMYLISLFSYKTTPKIAIIEIHGVISDFYSHIENIETALSDSSVKAVVLSIDSPGGTVGAAQEIYRALEKLRVEKPIVVSMGNVAASGGYYISAPANVIYANPGTITGSIGVIIQHVDLSQVLNKIGIKIDNIKSGKNKDILYPNKSLSPEQKALIEETIKDVYDQFLEAIVRYRPLTKEELRPYADGRIFSGRQAQKIKLVDKLGNIQDAIDEARKLAGLEDKHVIILKLGKKGNIIEKLLNSNMEGIFTPSGVYYLLSF